MPIVHRALRYLAWCDPELAERLADASGVLRRGLIRASCALRDAEDLLDPPAPAPAPGAAPAATPLSGGTANLNIPRFPRETGA